MKLLFATDGSFHSDNALETILAQPWPEGSECRIVTVRAPFHSHLASSMGEIGVMAARAEAALEEDLNKMMAEATGRLVEKFGKGKVTAVIRDGSPSQTIVELASEWRADLIVMGSHGTSGYNDEALGRITTLVINHAPCSVQIVHTVTAAVEGKKEKQHLYYEQARLLIALTNSAHSQAIVETVLSRPWNKESIFQILSIVPEPKSVIHSRFFKDPAIDEAHKKLYAAQKENLEKVLKDAADKIGAKFGKDKVTSHVLEGNVPSLILQIAQDWDADMILIGAHDRDKNFFQHFLGNVAQKVTDNSDCSIELVRPRG